MKSVFLVLLSGLFLMACSPAEFSTVPGGTETQLSLLDGETVEIVTDEELVDRVGQDPSDEDDGLATDEDDDGLYNDDDDKEYGVEIDDKSLNCRRMPSSRGLELMAWAKKCMITHNDDQDKDYGTNERPIKRHSCKERNVAVTPDKLANDEGVVAVIGCGNEYNDKKVSVCHHPNGEYAKRKTLCVGAPALKAFVGMNFKRSSAQDKNYAGPCQ